MHNHTEPLIGYGAAKRLHTGVEVNMDIGLDGWHRVNHFTYKGVRFEPVRSPLEQFIQTLKNMGIREGSRTWDYCIFDRGSHINVQVGPACFVFNADGSYREVQD